ncbi:MAG TPA: hypothetical protein PKY82_24425 [Pyrinomonadaceae bacterium]|nr:hypothetical protein [Pyrinomonadaceae bacterium]
MRKKVILAVIIHLLFFGLAIEGFGQTRQASQTNFAGDYNSLIKKLRTNGLTVKRGGRVSQPFFSISGRILTVDGEQVQIFEYKKKETAASEAGRISPSGSPVGTTMITWVAPPHFYKSGNLIVLYVGEKPKLIKALENALGRQFAGK